MELELQSVAARGRTLRTNWSQAVLPQVMALSGIPVALCSTCLLDSPRLARAWTGLE
jgi:hypothetical protein